MLHYSYKNVISSIFLYFCMPVSVAKITNCNEGHLCSSNRECCSQGCCPTQPRVSSDHVLNLFLINHWYFWCVIVAVLLAILCAYSLWKKRRQFCGWRTSEQNTQSEGDSTGSCYAPPQYSRCSSFHHPPPPYTEVTSKPDLYPLVFTCNSENGKSGTSYLMVQYFRNYIVRPAGSISATSTIDSLSSSFICNADEANTIVPPPYSRATSPEIAINSHFQQQFRIPSSASQTGLATDKTHLNKIISNIITGENAFVDCNNGKNVKCEIRGVNSLKQIDNKARSLILRENSIGELKSQQLSTSLKSKPCYSDIFLTNNYNHFKDDEQNNSTTEYSNNNINFSISKKNTGENSSNLLYNSCDLVSESLTSGPASLEKGNNFHNIQVLRKSLESCCQIFQKQQLPSSSLKNNASTVDDDNDANKTFKSAFPSNYLSSTTCSVISSLNNIEPSSPPQATSPTDDEIKNILENIRQLEKDDINVTEINPESKISVKKRPSALSGKTNICRQNKPAYIPIWNSNTRSIKSPVSNHNFFRGRKYWTSKSEPATPATSLPKEINENLDQSPLLQQYEEENE